MIRQIHDQFSKEWLAELLRPVGGKVETQRELSGEVYYADVSVEPSPTAPEEAFQRLGLLGQLARQPCLLEHFWNPPKFAELRSCLSKLFLAHTDSQRRLDKQGPSPLSEAELPRLWVLTTSITDDFLANSGAHSEVSTWGNGVYLLANFLKTGLVVLNRLPPTPETLWLRILGRGETQRDAVLEFLALAEADPAVCYFLEILSRWGVYVTHQNDLTKEEQELIMNVEAVYQKWKYQTLLEGLQQGLREGRQEGRQETQRVFLEQLLRLRFGVSEEALVQALQKLPTQESLSLILQLSRDELRTKMGLS